MHKAHVSEEKRKEVQDIISLVKKYKVVGIVDMTNLPALPLQRIKKNLRELVFKFSKKSLIKIALEQLKTEKKGIDLLEEKLTGMPVLILTNEDAFELAKSLKKNQSNAPARPGQIAPFDLIIPAGPTNFAAGPMIGELGLLGIKTKVENGKLTIINDKLLVKEGDIIGDKQAELLAKVGVEPMKIGLNLVCTYQNGEILSKEVLFVDEEAYINNLKIASREAVALALEIGYVVKDTVELLVAKAYREAKALSEKAKIENIKIEEVQEKVLEEKLEIVKEEIKPKPGVQMEEVKPEPVMQKQEHVKQEHVKQETKQEIIQAVKEAKIMQASETTTDKKIETKKVEFKETRLEKEMRKQREVYEEQPARDAREEVVVECKEDGYEKMADNAKNLLNKLVDEKLKQNPVQKLELREKQEIENVSKFINELKDKKAKGEL